MLQLVNTRLAYSHRSCVDSASQVAPTGTPKAGQGELASQQHSVPTGLRELTSSKKLSDPPFPLKQIPCLQHPILKGRGLITARQAGTVDPAAPVCLSASASPHTWQVLPPNCRHPQRRPAAWIRKEPGAADLVLL
ncbi:U6 snRNA-associated Sm-like protein LSm4 isoform X2 [Eublepharis macularius]|uniref:U6 snRNA-associated Sm-like protein LSm4 isoform X2 n=1 Tax=Eublepharis macularius TaxID=481883 RepID=A0AA97JH96_EUBMA|nr:U6 snRNA-associated Sm-like protein LSm4 isoform X2 [Eublepharis macularius]